MNLALNPATFWKQSPASVRVTAAAIYVALLANGVLLATGTAMLPFGGVWGVLSSVIVGYIMWDSATVVLKGGRVGSILSVVFAAAVTGYLASLSGGFAVIGAVIAVLVLASIGLLFTASAREYQSTRGNSSARELLKNARAQKKQREGTPLATQDGDPEPIAATPMNRQQRRAADKAQRSKNAPSRSRSKRK